MSAAAVAASSPPLSPSQQMQDGKRKFSQDDESDNANGESSDERQNENTSAERSVPAESDGGGATFHTSYQEPREKQQGSPEAADAAGKQQPETQGGQKSADSLDTRHAPESSNSGPHTNSVVQSLPEEPRKEPPARAPNLESLPVVIRAILSEVARTGEFHALPWYEPKSAMLEVDEKTQAGSVSKGQVEPMVTDNAGKKVDAASVGDVSISAAARDDTLGLAPFLKGGSDDSPSASPNRKAASPFSSRPESPYLNSSLKRRNGLHKPKHRRMHSDSAISTGKRKRPFHAIRSVGSGAASPTAKASESDPEDTIHSGYESESTLTTINSEVSADRREHLPRKNQRTAKNAHAGAKPAASSSKLGMVESNPSGSLLQYRSLCEVFRIALTIVLDRSYGENGGYKLSPAEKRRNEILMKARLMERRSSNNSETKQPMHIITSDETFKQRRNRLIAMLTPSKPTAGANSTPRTGGAKNSPPFTIQRLAEVLLSPNRFYRQTHKLCNCLEKLLLVKAPLTAFGGSTGGDTTQSRQEEQERIALAHERDRQEYEIQQRMTQRHALELHHMQVAASAGVGGRHILPGLYNYGADHIQTNSPIGSAEPDNGMSLHADGPGSPVGGSPADEQADANARASLQAAARASLRTKFDHVGIDPHSAAMSKQDRNLNTEERGRPSSPPPPSHSASPLSPQSQKNTLSSSQLAQHSLDHGVSRQDIDRINESGMYPNHHHHSPGHDTKEVHLLQLHQAAAIASSQMRAASSDDMIVDSDSMPHHRGNFPTKDMEDGDYGRSSASNSDIDSESDDLSLDDSASDRSDGSDSGQMNDPPFSAARAMALNRIQQQQRLYTRNFAPLECFRPPPDTEYQSGDSIDSMRAEDSCGSDSSSSDIND